MKRAGAILEVRLRFPETGRFLGGTQKREFEKPLPVGGRYELVRLVVDPRDAELAIGLRFRISLARCDILDEELDGLRDLVKRRLTPYLLGHLFADYDLSVLDYDSDIAVDVVRRACRRRPARRSAGASSC